MKQIDLVARTRPQALERVQERRDAMSRVGKATDDEIAIAVTSLAASSSPDDLNEFSPDAVAEAIILEDMRPAWLIRNDIVQVAGDFDRTDLFEANRDALEREAKMVGRVDLIHHLTHDFVGTGWMIEEDVVCTNRHVAMAFVNRNRLGRWDFADGSGSQKIEATVSFVRQHATPEDRSRQAIVTEILHVAGSREADVAFLRVLPPAGVEPLQLETTAINEATPCAVVGYPAWDGRRNDRRLMERIFGGVYDLKRFAPGLAFPSRQGRATIEADYSSLGGNSGSAILALETARVIGLHFAGRFREANQAVPADVVAAALRRTRTRVEGTDVPTETPTSPKGDFADRAGYDPGFLGTGRLTVPIPGPGRHGNDVAAVEGSDDGILRYIHFSVVQNAKRRLPLLTAVNIDGAQSKLLKREGTWRLDGRIAKDHQIGNELYTMNSLDRGHLVRRMDPGWGDVATAKAAERDTFHYTNCAPQHEDLNQKSWLGLEEYVLSSSRTRGFKVSVLTGPIFRDDDPLLIDRDAIAIPLEYWKVVAMVNDETGKLSVTGYVLSHGEMIRSITEAAFVYGEYETYQVPVKRIAEATGLEFGDLADSDPLREREASGYPGAVLISGPEDLEL